MPHEPRQPSTALGVAIADRRAGRAQRSVAAEAGLPYSTLSRIERGTHAPSADTALALARWLGWSMEQVMEAAKTPAAPPTDPGLTDAG